MRLLLSCQLYHCNYLKGHITESFLFCTSHHYACLCNEMFLWIQRHSPCLFHLAYERNTCKLGVGINMFVTREINIWLFLIVLGLLLVIIVDTLCNPFHCEAYCHSLKYFNFHTSPRSPSGSIPVLQLRYRRIKENKKNNARPIKQW